jgi:hypothetical protein
LFAGASSRRTSTTWDEIVLIAGGARGWETGRWDIATDHPPLMQYLYGIPVYLLRPNVAPFDAPDIWREPHVQAGDPELFGPRYEYARSFLWRSGNDPLRLTAAARSVALASFVVLVLIVFAAVHFGLWAASRPPRWLHSYLM